MLVIAGLLVWRLSVPGPAFTAIGGCNELLNANVLAEIPGTEGAEVEGVDAATSYVTPASVDTSCSVVTDNGWVESSVLQVSISRYSAATEQDDYVLPQQQHDLLFRSPIERALGDGATTGDGVEIEDGAGGVVIADVEIRDLSLGETGQAVDYSNVEIRDEYLDFEDPDDWAAASFTTRNVLVSLTYEGTPGMERGERLDAVTDAARLVKQYIEATGVTA
ncbi:hypothetical protein ACFOVU_03815 [Nocardiopsis sediminis]|uniref:DUF3558 domain-containing protein n=1 Tax=Nocardiopsis sediminis TaxID=1778267 RepID=A0ABV8FK29_9ACTN